MLEVSMEDPVWPKLRVAAALAIGGYVVGLPLGLAALVLAEDEWRPSKRRSTTPALDVRPGPSRPRKIEQRSPPRPA
eukprot:tig00021070_g17813.t1